MYNLEPIAQPHQRKPYGYKVSMAVLQEKGQLLNVIIRHATPNDFAVIRKIERMAGAAFEQYDMSEIANDEPPSIVVLKQYCSEQRIWIAVDESDRPVAYIMARPLGPHAHIDQVSVTPEHARNRIGSTLIDSVEHWAASHGLSALTLSTFCGVPWNAPYYQTLGFREIPENTLPSELRAIRLDEKRLGLDRWPRCCMKRNVRPIMTSHSPERPAR